MQSSRTVIGLDIAKRVFQLHWVDMETGELMNLRLTRAKLLEPFGNRAPCLVGMEACGGSQHWARRLQSLGHEVRLLPAKMVRPFVSGNKNDARDAQAIWAAVQQPGVKTVAVKSEEQQGILALHRMRQQLVKFRTAQINRAAEPGCGGTWLRPSSGSRSGCRQWSSRRCAISVGELEEVTGMTSWSYPALLDARRHGIGGNVECLGDARRVPQQRGGLSGFPASRFEVYAVPTRRASSERWRHATTVLGGVLGGHLDGYRYTQFCKHTGKTGGGLELPPALPILVLRHD